MNVWMIVKSRLFMCPADRKIRGHELKDFVGRGRADDRLPLARKNSPLLFRLFNRGNLGRWPNRRALQSRQNRGVEQGYNRRLLVLVMPFLRPLFRWIFLELTGQKIFPRKKKSAGIFVTSMGKSSGSRAGRREASPSSQTTGFELGFCRASKALLGGLKPLFLLCFSGSKKSRKFGARASSPHGRR